MSLDKQTPDYTPEADDKVLTQCQDFTQYDVADEKSEGNLPPPPIPTFNYPLISVYRAIPPFYSIPVLHSSPLNKDDIYHNISQSPNILVIYYNSCVCMSMRYYYKESVAK